MGSILKVKDKNSGKWIDIPAIKGDAGKSAYELAVEGGYEGTEKDFIATLNASLSGVEIAHLTNKNNPHEVTAEQAKALPVEGGILTGTLGFCGGYGEVGADPNHANLRAQNKTDDRGNSRALLVKNSNHSPNIDGAICFRDTVEGKYQDYKLYGEHNKPTAYDVGAVNKAGDTMSGNLKFKKFDNGECIIYKNHNATADYGMIISDTAPNGNTNQLLLCAKNDTFKYKNIAGTTSLLFGEHNKPIGTYTGTGGVSRTIDIGGAGYTVCIHYARGLCLATPAGILHWTISGEAFCDASTYKHIGRNYGYFENGKLFFSAEAAGLLDLNGYTYWYQVL